MVNVRVFAWAVEKQTEQNNCSEQMLFSKQKQSHSNVLFRAEQLYKFGTILEQLFRNNYLLFSKKWTSEKRPLMIILLEQGDMTGKFQNRSGEIDQQDLH